MAVLTWDLPGTRTYQYGIQKVALYGALGESSNWDGVTAISEDSDGSEFEEIFFDSDKVFTVVYRGYFSCSVSAIGFPRKFLNYLGVKESRPGLFITNQEKSLFNMSYQTLSGDGGYKIHLVSNIIATRESRDHKTIESNTTPDVMTWNFSTIPDKSYGLVKPSSHIVLDSNKIDSITLAMVENYLYGTQSTDPMFPSREDFLNII